MVSGPDSDIAEGGRLIGVAVKILESFRWIALDGCAGVLPAVPRTFNLRLIWVQCINKFRKTRNEILPIQVLVAWIPVQCSDREYLPYLATLVSSSEPF